MDNKTQHIEGRAVSYSTYMNHGCRCAGCTDHHRIKHKEWRMRATPEQRKRMNKRNSGRVARINNAMPTPNKGKPWSAADTAVALDATITVREAARRLGRTLYSVKQLRSSNRIGKTIPTPNKGTPWTQEDTMIALNSNLTSREVALRVGRTVDAVKAFRSNSRVG